MTLRVWDILASTSKVVGSFFIITITILALDESDSSGTRPDTMMYF